MRKLLALVLVMSVLLSMLLSGCSLLGVSQEEYDRLQAKYDDLNEEFEELEEEYDELEKKYKKLTGDDSSWEDAPAVDAPVADAPAAEAPSRGFSEEEVLSQLSVVQANFCNDWESYTFLEVENQSDYTISGSAEVKFYDDDGNLLGVGDAYMDTLSPGEFGLLACYSSDAFAWADYEFSVYEETYYRSITPYLAWDSVSGTNKEIVTIYNESDEQAYGVYVQMLFYLGDELVDYSSYYYGEIDAGDDGSMELYCYEEYDNYIIYYNGYTY